MYAAVIVMHALCLRMALSTSFAGNEVPNHLANSEPQGAAWRMSFQRSAAVASGMLPGLLSMAWAKEASFSQRFFPGPADILNRYASRSCQSSGK